MSALTVHFFKQLFATGVDDRHPVVLANEHEVVKV
jgi:hypothetical protein